MTTQWFVSKGSSLKNKKNGVLDKYAGMSYCSPNTGGGTISPKVCCKKQFLQYWHIRRYEDRIKVFRSKIENRRRLK